MARCRDCGGAFQARGAWQRLCWDCWREAERRRAWEEGYRQGLRDGRAQATAPAPAPLDAVGLRRLLRLVHPDVHPPERAELAAEATRTVIALLAKARGPG